MATLSLVRSFDARSFFVDDALFPQYTYSTTALSSLLFSIARAFRQLTCIFLDGHPGLEPEGLVNPLASGQLPQIEPPLLLSIPRCQTELPASFFASGYLRSLVYLDVSDMPGSLKKPLVQRTLNPAHLPSLRILKAQGREMDNATASLLFKAFGGQLWSVDLSRNKLADGIFDAMHHYSFPAQTSMTGDFDVEGRLVSPSNAGGTTSFGQFCFIRESKWSASFSHPHRHLVDAPLYTRHAEDGRLPTVSQRLNGRVRITQDSADAAKAMLAGGAGSHGPSLGHVHGMDICRGHQGITHLYLNGNNISAAGLASMIRSSPGQLQHLECDPISFRLPEAAPPSWLSKARLSGTLGAAHVFRPVFSANLQALRVHHSLVTQLLSLELDGLSPMANLWVAETHLLPRAEFAYPEAFVPDMNPRLQSLVLTRIPRYSTGPLIDKLIGFLRMASTQERAIQDIENAGGYGPVTLPGLRHIRLEFEPDPREELGDDSQADFDLDVAGVMDDASEEFSFFGESKWSSLPSATKPSSSSAHAAVPQSTPKPTPQTDQSARPPSPHASSPRPEIQNRTQPGLVADPTPQALTTIQHEHPADENDPEYQKHIWTWNDRPLTQPVWIGKSSDSPKHTPTVREYMRLLRAHPRLQADPVPVSPCHVKAGVPLPAGPTGTYVFSAAWEAILLPVTTAGATPGTATCVGGGAAVAGASTIAVRVPKPTRGDLRAMRDVVAALKAYRAGTRRRYEDLCKQYGQGQEQATGGARREEGPRVRWGEPHFHWGGRLEVQVEDGRFHHQSKYWR